MTPLVQACWWTGLVVGFVGATVFAGLETAVYCLNRVRLRVRASGPSRDRASRVLQEELAHPERLLSVQLIVFVLMNDLAATSATALMSGYGYSAKQVILSNIALLTPLFFVLAESVPKELGRLDADRLARAGAGLMRGTRWILTALLVLPLVRWIAGLVGRFTGGDGEAGLAQLSRDRLAAMIHESAQDGSMSVSQAGLFERALEFAKVGIDDEMIPWSRAAVLRLSWDRRRVAEVVSRTPHAVYPVVDDTGRVAGAVRLLELCRRPTASLEALLTPVMHLSAQASAHVALLSLRHSKAWLGVVEQDSKPVGIVTVDDLIEPLTKSRRK